MLSSSHPRMIQIYLLGRFNLTYAGQMITGLHPRVQSLLAMILLSPELAIARELAAIRLWPNSSDSQARTNLRHLLHTLRSTLPNAEHYLKATPDMLVWNQNSDFHCDVLEFHSAASKINSVESLDEAITLYQGDLIPTCFDDWIEPDRSRLRDLYISTLQRQTDLLEKEGDLAGAIQFTNRMLQIDPIRETTYCRLMELHASLGDRAAVMRTFEVCSSNLKKELGVEPGPETLATFEALLQPKSTFKTQDQASISTQLKITHLPAPLDSLIGRNDEINLVIELIHGHRLVTLTGIGGVGKTRLAQEIAWKLAGTPAPVIGTDGIWWFDLAPISTLELLIQTVAVTLQITPQADRSVMESLLESLGFRLILLILDNCEHLLEVTAQFIFDVLRACPQLRVITTSRVSLHLSGEAVFYVPPLSNQADDLSALSESELLFYERARAANPTFSFQTQHLETVRAICRKLNGIPLAIELAAARIRMLTPLEIAQRLEKAFELLSQKKHGIPPRHQTLRSTLDWSYQLLNESEARLFRSLSVFSNGFTLYSAMAVCGFKPSETGELLNGLEALIDKSLLRPLDSAARQPRMILLELIREYALDRLHESGELDRVRSKHALYFLDLAVRLEPLLESPQQATWLNQLETEHANLRSALAWMKETGDTENGLRLSSSLAMFHFMRGYLREGYAWMVDFLSFPAVADLALRAKACDRAGLLARYQGAYDQANSWISESLTIRRQLNDLHGMADSFDNLGYVALHQDKDQLALEYYQEALTLHQQRNNLQGIADSSSHLAMLAYRRGNFSEAKSLHQSSLEMWRGLEDHQGIAWALYYLGDVSLAVGELTRARDQFRESLIISEAIRFQWGIVNAIEGIACFAALTGQPERAIRLAGGAAFLRETISLPVPPNIQTNLQRMLSPAYHLLGEEQAAALHAEGKLLAYDELIQQSIRL
jgi:predicted ATPase/DNA-binding SARP family transcriptional activator